MSHVPTTRPEGHGHGELDRFEDPGVPPHRYRLTDKDPAAERRAELQVAGLFLLSVLGTIFALVSYFVWQPKGTLLSIRMSTFTLGMGIAVSTFCIGIGAVQWAKTLMSDHEGIDERHQQRGSDEDRRIALEMLHAGNVESGIGRRPLIRNTLFASLGLFALPLVVLLRDLGPLPKDSLRHTMWKKGTRLTTDPLERPIKVDDVTMGSVFHVIPEGLGKAEDELEQKAKAAVLLIRVDPNIVEKDPSRDGWDVDGIYAYSKICTHVGCPVALYEQQTHHLLCPCHQSTFDLTKHCKVIFGPAAHALPQLPITVDDQGYLVAQSDFHEPVGPSFWERG